MSYRKQNFAHGEFYHLYNRGTEKREIFLDEKDYNHFLYLMYVCNTTKSLELRKINEKFDRIELLVNIGAYVLMPNHFHILITENTEGGISKYMLKLMTAYTMYFNKKYKRTGKLYEGVFKSTHLNTDNYLKYIYSYVHLNPAKLIDKNWKENRTRNSIKLLDYVFSYKYSSIKEYSENSFTTINPEVFPDYFIKINDHKKELFGWLNFRLEN
ncbi:MAG: transposase [Candidatus Paceibacterota bacterium]